MRETPALTITVPEAPRFGEALPIDAAPQVLAFLARRRSASAFTLHAPGPSRAELDDLLRLSARVPDHGKLAPWRFIILEGAAKDAVGDKLTTIGRSRPDATRAKAMAALGKFTTPPLAVFVISHPVAGDIPEWEQILSAGAVCATLLNAASAMGYGANWITDWYSTDEAGKAAIGVHPDERVAGVIYIGRATEAPLERVRPDVSSLTTRP